MQFCIASEGGFNGLGASAAASACLIHFLTAEENGFEAVMIGGIPTVGELDDGALKGIPQFSPESLGFGSGMFFPWSCALNAALNCPS